MSTTHPAWCLGTEGEAQEHRSATLHAAKRTDIADIRLSLVQLQDVVSIRLELMEDNITNMYLLPPEQAQALAVTTTGLLAWAGQETASGRQPRHSPQEEPPWGAGVAPGGSGYRREPFPNAYGRIRGMSRITARLWPRQPSWSGADGPEGIHRQGADPVAER